MDDALAAIVINAETVGIAIYINTVINAGTAANIHTVRGQLHHLPLALQDGSVRCWFFDRAV